MASPSVDINKTLDEVTRLIESEKNMSPALRAALNVLLVMVKLLSDRLGLNSKNSSKPPSTDTQKIPKTRKPSTKKAGGQTGHEGSTLMLVDEPDEIIPLAIDKRSLPKDTYKTVGFERRQVVEIKLIRHIIEYRAEVLENSLGQRFVAEFPSVVPKAAQYGATVKAHAVYLSQYQLIPYERVQAQFSEMFDINLSTGSLFRFNQQAYQLLEMFERCAKYQLHASALIHVDETSTNINGQRLWLHNASNEHWTLICPHKKRGHEAMDAIGILPHYTGVLVHDHWKPYYHYDTAKHALCNAHHLRELARAHEQDGQQWAQAMAQLLNDINAAVTLAGGVLTTAEAQQWRKKYRRVLRDADKECPAPEATTGALKRGRKKRSKARNLVERLRNFETDTLRFMTESHVPFTNNQGERDIRMAKVQQKISGCFRAMEGAEIFCRIRSYLSTCDKNGVNLGDAVEHLFQGTWPVFLQIQLRDMGMEAE